MRRFLGDRRGNIAVIFGLSFLPLMFLAGTGIDYVYTKPVFSPQTKISIVR